MTQFSYMMLRLYRKGNFTNEVELAKDQFEQRTESSQKAAKPVLDAASTELWKCDPEKYIKDETYIEITQLLQGYIENEVDLNSDGVCSATCEDYTNTKSYSCYENLYCQQQRQCKGKIVDCKFIDSHLQVCLADSLSSRRYEYVEYSNGVLGHKQQCSNGTVAADSWLRWIWQCSYCMCLCDEQGVYSDRYINLRYTVSDIASNMVITGLRFNKKNRVIHIQIQEGKLLPGGIIDPKTIRWVPMEDYNITNTTNGKDYHTLSWEERNIDLDDLTTDENKILTGIRFKKNGSHIKLEIYQTLFDFETGFLLESKENSTWKNNNNARKQLSLNNPDVPIRTITPSQPDSKSDQYIEFVNTGIYNDAAQTTVPFIDSQPVESSIPVPLTGVGIYHKGQKGFGGFIGIKIFVNI